MHDLKVLTKEEKDGLDVPRISEDQVVENTFLKKVYIESYGCQMNFADSEVVTSILINKGYGTTSNYDGLGTLVFERSQACDPIPVPVKAKWAMLGLAAIDLFGGVTSVSGDNIAHFAHLGGALTGFLIVLYWNKMNRQSLY